MIDVGYNNGDIAISQYGDIILCPSEDSDVIQMANNHIRLMLGHNKYHKDIGNEVYGRRIKWNDTGRDIVAECCSTAIMQDPRINTIDDIVVEYGKNHEAIVSYTVTYSPTDLKKISRVKYYDEQLGREMSMEVDNSLIDSGKEDVNEVDEERTVSSRISIDAFNTTEEVLV